MKSKPASTPPEIRQKRWTKDEMRLFKIGFQQFGRRWSLYVPLIPTRSAKQVRSHAQKVLGKQEVQRTRCGKCAGLMKTEMPKTTRQDMGIQCDLADNSEKQEEGCPWDTDFELEA